MCVRVGWCWVLGTASMPSLCSVSTGTAAAGEGCDAAAARALDRQGRALDVLRCSLLIGAADFPGCWLCALLLLERRLRVGGAAGTEARFPGALACPLHLSLCGTRVVRATFAAAGCAGAGCLTRAALRRVWGLGAELAGTEAGAAGWRTPTGRPIAALLCLLGLRVAVLRLWYWACQWAASAAAALACSWAAATWASKTAIRFCQGTVIMNKHAQI